jgi:hypothetical protein
MPTKSSILALALSLCVCFAAGETTNCNDETVGFRYQVDVMAIPVTGASSSITVGVVKGICREADTIVRHPSHRYNYLKTRQSLIYQLPQRFCALGSPTG